MLLIYWRCALLYSRWGKLCFSWPDDIELTCKCGKGGGSSESFFNWTAEDEATCKHACREGSSASLRARKPIDNVFAAQGIAKDDVSDEDYDPECDSDDGLGDDLEEIPRTVRTAVQRETLGPVVGSGPDTGGSAKNNTDKPKEVEEEVDVDARSKRDGKQDVTASIRLFVQAARVEAEEEAASIHTAAQDDTETVAGQVNVEAIDDDADSNTLHNDAVNGENNNEITSRTFTLHFVVLLVMLLCMLLTIIEF
ncbi:hypothetical protein PI126_g20530 [Phytophthora idaei]|nr:hypothetical protein PI126_g20530 [Phytophthora idaei]